MNTRIIDGEISWLLRNKSVEAALTQRGGHLAPVRYRDRGKTISLFTPPPWRREPIANLRPINMQVMRGDFFCMPFGESVDTYRGERHGPHGETSSSRWKLVTQSLRNDRCHLHTRMRTRARAGVVDKHIILHQGHPAVYCRHVLSTMSGPMSFGHHAILKFPPDASCGVISTGPFALGQVFDGELGDPATGSYSCLKPGAKFKSLRRVATVFGRNTDVSRYPARAGYDDLLMLQARPVRRLGWSAVTFAGHGYVWFALKDTAVLPGTVIWFSNGGRHTHPWNGRHRNTLGLEEVCSYFHTGLAASARKNPHTAMGLKTSCMLNPKRPLVINYIMAACAVPPGFDRVASITATSKGVCLRSDSNIRVHVRVNANFVFEGMADT